MEAALAASAKEMAEKEAQLARTEMLVQKLKEELRLERIGKYGKRSEKLSDLQLELLDRKPAVSSEEIAAEVERGPLPDSAENNKQRRTRKHHPGRNKLPAHLE